jgi:hypothetical protein
MHGRGFFDAIQEWVLCRSLIKPVRKQEILACTSRFRIAWNG